MYLVKICFRINELQRMSA